MLHLQYYARSLQLRSSPVRYYLRHPVPEENAPARSVSLSFGERTTLTLRYYQLDDIIVKNYTYTDCPIWTLSTDIFCEGFKCPTKRTVSPETTRALFLEHMRHHTEEYALYTDGSKNEAGVGCAAVCSEQSVRRHLRPESSIFTAELNAIILALEVIDSLEYSKYVIFADSRSVIQAIQHYNSRHPLVSDIVQTLIHLYRRNIFVRLCWVPSHVSIRGNERVDREARLATAPTPPFYQDLPFRDYFPTIKAVIWTRWREEWTGTINYVASNLTLKHGYHQTVKADTYQD